MYARIYAKLLNFLFSITSNFEKVMPPKRDRFVIPALATVKWPLERIGYSGMTPRTTWTVTDISEHIRYIFF